MQKCFFKSILCLGLVATMSSCSQEEPVPAIDDANIYEPKSIMDGKEMTFSVETDEGVRSRAQGDGSGATRLCYAFLDATTKTPLIYSGQTGAPEATKTSTGFQLTVTLDPQKKYVAVFMASGRLNIGLTSDPSSRAWYPTFVADSKNTRHKAANKLYWECDPSGTDIDLSTEAGYNKSELFMFRDFSKVIDINKSDCPTSFTLTRPYAEVVVLASDATMNASGLNKYTPSIMMACYATTSSTSKKPVHSMLDFVTGKIEVNTDNDYMDLYDFEWDKKIKFGGTSEYANYNVLYRAPVLVGERTNGEEYIGFSWPSHNKTLVSNVKIKTLQANTRYIFITGGTGDSSTGSGLLGDGARTLSLTLSTNMNNGTTTNF